MGAPAFCCHSSPCCVVHLSTESFGFKIHGLANVGYPQLWKYFNIISIWLTKRAYFCGTLQWYYQDQQKKRRPQRINLQSPYLNDGTLHVYPLRASNAESSIACQLGDTHVKSESAGCY